MKDCNVIATRFGKPRAQFPQRLVPHGSLANHDPRTLTEATLDQVGDLLSAIKPDMPEPQRALLIMTARSIIKIARDKPGGVA
jgi:hypothetical protein